MPFESPRKFSLITRRLPSTRATYQEPALISSTLLSTPSAPQVLALEPPPLRGETRAGGSSTAADSGRPRPPPPSAVAAASGEDEADNRVRHWEAVDATLRRPRGEAVSGGADDCGDGALSLDDDEDDTKSNGVA